MATFFQGTRYCGSAVRILQVRASDSTAAPPAAAVGTVAVEPDAEPPDLTVHISAVDPARPGCLRWLVVTEEGGEGERPLRITPAEIEGPGVIRV
jgi:hypothetical protein